MVDMRSVRWGVVGPGRIAAKLVRDFVHMPDAEVVAVASRSAERARAFADANDISRAHGSYRAIVDDDEVDALYIATPHPQHRAVALAAIKAGKALLVEKSFTVTPAATREIAAAAGDAGVFVMEAMWTRFQPAVVRLRELLADGAIGEVRGVQGELGVNAPTDPLDRYLLAKCRQFVETGTTTRRSAAGRCSTSPSTRFRSHRWCSARRTR